MSEDIAGLYKKLAEVMGEVGRVAKNGKNTFHKYDYVTEADLVDAVRSKLADRNVILIPSVEGVEERTITTDRGKASTVTTVRVAFTFCDGDTGATHRAEWAGAGDDSADKGIYKAYTGALKYFLMKSFLIATGDDPENDSRQSPGRPAAPPKPVGPPIDADRAGVIGQKISDAMTKGLSGTDLSLMFSAAGATPQKIDKAAIAKLTVDQADALEGDLLKHIGAPA